MAEKKNNWDEESSKEKESTDQKSKEKKQDVPPKGTEEELEDMPVDEQLILTEAEEIKRLEAALLEGDERYLRLAAEYDNYRKRTSEEISQTYPRVTCITVEKFLPILDNFQRAMDYEPGTEDYTKGIDLIHRSFMETLEGLGVEAFGEVGDPFNPEIHNAIMHTQDPELGENVLSMVLQKGYRIGDRVIRHAMVQTAN